MQWSRPWIFVVTLLLPLLMRSPSWAGGVISLTLETRYMSRQGVGPGIPTVKKQVAVGYGEVRCMPRGDVIEHVRPRSEYYGDEQDSDSLAHGIS
jgi:hypothetical protein